MGSTLGSYDLFAKTVPGILFFIGFVSLFPSIPEISIQEPGFGFVTIMIIVTVVSGFIIGQALHAIAEAAESIAYRFTEFVSDRFKYVRSDYWSEREGISHSLEEFDEEETLIVQKYFRIILASLLKVPVRGYCWLLTRVHEVVLPHRVWFRSRLKREFKKNEKPDGLYEWFKWECRDHLQSMDLDLVDQHEKIYRFVMSYLEFVNGGRAKKFQATSSFCRSTWITFLGFSLVYYVILLINVTPIMGYEPLIQAYLYEYGFKIPTSLLLGSMLFMYSSGKYKKHFTEYIVVDFYNVVGSDADTSGMAIEVDQLDIKVDDK